MFQDRAQWKGKLFTCLESKLKVYTKCFIVGVDNVTSKQIQQIRTSLRGHAEIIMGKNTMIRKVIRNMISQDENLERLLPYIKENIGFVFMNEDLNDIKGIIDGIKISAPAKVGAIAPNDVSIPPQNTGLGPEKTSFFQALAIPTKISRGTIEILSVVHLIKKGHKVGPSEAALLNMMKISPFTYGLIIKHVCDQGCVYNPTVLDITPEDIRNRFLESVRNLAAISMALQYPSFIGVSHSFINNFKKLVAISVATDYKLSEKIKEYLKNLSKCAVPATPVAIVTAAAPAAKKEEAKKEESEEDDMGMGLFD